MCFLNWVSQYSNVNYFMYFGSTAWSEINDVESSRRTGNIDDRTTMYSSKYPLHLTGYIRNNNIKERRYRLQNSVFKNSVQYTKFRAHDVFLKKIQTTEVSRVLIWGGGGREGAFKITDNLIWNSLYRLFIVKDSITLHLAGRFFIRNLKIKEQDG